LNKLSQLLPNMNQQSVNSNVAIINKLSHFINDENFLSLASKANQNSNLMFNEPNKSDTNMSTALKSKPIGYERHEKQINNSNNNNINNISSNNNNNNNNNLQFVNNQSNFQNINQNRNSSLIDELNFPNFLNNFNNSNVFEQQQQQQQNMRNFVSPLNNQKQQNIDLPNNGIDLLTEAHKAKLLSQFDANLSMLNPAFNGFNQNDSNIYNNNNNNEFQAAPVNTQWMNSFSNDFNLNRLPFSPINNQSISNLLIGNANQMNLASAKIGLVPAAANPTNFLAPGVGVYGFSAPELVNLNSLNQFQSDDQSHIQSQIIDSLKNNNWNANQFAEPYLFGQFFQQQQKQNNNF